MRAAPFRKTEADIRRENANLVRRLCDVATRKPRNSVPASTNANSLHGAIRRRRVDTINRENRELLDRLERARAQIPKVEDTEKMFALHLERRKFVLKHAPDKSTEWSRDRKHKHKECKPEDGRRQSAAKYDPDDIHRWDASLHSEWKAVGEIECLSAREKSHEATSLWRVKGSRTGQSENWLCGPLSKRQLGVQLMPLSARGCGETDTRANQASRDLRCSGVEQGPKALSPGEHFGDPLPSSSDSDASLLEHTDRSKSLGKNRPYLSENTLTKLDLSGKFSSMERKDSISARSPVTGKSTDTVSEDEYSDTFTALSEDG